MGAVMAWTLARRRESLYLHVIQVQLDGKNSNWLFEKRASLSLMETQLEAPLSTSQFDSVLMSGEFEGMSTIGYTWLPRDTSLSRGSYRFARRSFSSQGSSTLTKLCTIPAARLLNEGLPTQMA